MSKVIKIASGKLQTTEEVARNGLKVKNCKKMFFFRMKIFKNLQINLYNFILAIIRKEGRYPSCYITPRLDERRQREKQLR